MQCKCKCKYYISIVSSVSVRPVNKIAFEKKSGPPYLHSMYDVRQQRVIYENHNHIKDNALK